MDADITGRGLAPSEEMTVGHTPFRFPGIIEKVPKPSSCIESLIECLLCESVPICWAAPDIGEVSDKKSMVVATDLEAIKSAIDSVGEEDYKARVEFIRRTRDKAAHYANHEKAAAIVVTRAGIKRRKPKT